MDGDGPTVKEAKRDATRKIEKVLDGAYSPVLISGRTIIGIVFRTPHGWWYKIVERTANQFDSCEHLNDDKDEAERRCRHHMG
jgi:hypothetical protein